MNELKVPKDLKELPSKLQLQNDAWHKIVREMETAINNVKAPKDKCQSDVFLEGLKKDLNTIMELHYGKLNIMQGYVQMRKQNDKLYKKCKSLEGENDAD